MAEQKKATFSYQSLQINKSQHLGHGSYGAVYKAKCDQLPCAAKVLHPTIIDPRDQGVGRVMAQFRQECALLESIRHPNIVQYLAMTLDPESRLPVLLMELLDESLTKMLERSQQSLAYYIQVDICHDVALAIAYLHSNNIIHRDLSSNNVLIIAGRRAKVTDFGMSKLASTTRTALTVCPGTLAYMPPEALRDPPVHTKKLDCFSEGVIMIQVCTRLWPEPGPRTQLVQDFRSPTGTTEMPVLETERRKNHIDLINPTNDLLPIATYCLKYQERERPSSEELCQRLAGLRESTKYRESARKEQDIISDVNVQEIRRQVEELKEREVKNTMKIERQQDEIEKREKQIKLQGEKLKDREHELQKTKRELESKLASQERYIYLLNKKLEEEKGITVELQTTHVSSLGVAEQQEQNPCQQREELLTQHKYQLPSQQKIEDHHYDNVKVSKVNAPPPLPPRTTSKRRRSKDTQSNESQSTPAADNKTHPLKASTKQHSHSHSRNYMYLNLQVLTSKKVALNWKDGGRAPLELVRGDAVVSGNEAFFVNYGGEVCAYDTTTKRWRTLTKCLYRGSSLAIVNGSLTTIGGFDGGIIRSPKDNLLSLSGKNWMEVLPPMPTKRCNTASVTTERELIVAGGESGVSYMKRLDTVEVMNTKTLVWSTVASLPHPYSSASATICGSDDLYMLGGLDDIGETKSVLTCSLTELLHSTRESMSVWYKAADSAFHYSTCAAVNGELVAVGGRDSEDEKVTAAVHKYKSGANSWDLISSMPTARHQCLVAVLPSKELIVVGGNKHSMPTDTVEIADF